MRDLITYVLFALVGLIAVPTSLAAAPPTLKGTSWCVIIGSQPYPALDKARAAVAKARAAGLPGAAVYDSRGFSNLRWGQLAAIAGAYPKAKAAKKARQLLKKRRISSYAKRCVAKKGGAKPLDAAAEKALPKAIGVPKKLTAGCFGYSPGLQAAVCVTGTGGTQSGQHFSVSFPGWEDAGDIVIVDNDDQIGDDLVLKKEGRRELAKRLAKGHFLPWALIPETTSDLYKLVQKSKVTDTTEEETGSWDTTKVTADIKCKTGLVAGLVDRSIEGSTGLHIIETVIPNGRFVFFQIAWSWAYEGTYGGATEVQRFDLKHDCEKDI